MKKYLWVSLMIASACTKDTSMGLFAGNGGVSGEVRVLLVVPTSGSGVSGASYERIIVDLDRRQLAVTPAQTPTGKLPLGAHIDKTEHCNELISPNGNFVVSCSKVPQGPVQIIVKDRRTGKELLSSEESNGVSLAGIAWAPDSTAIAILTKREHYGKNPIMYAIGHPVPYMSFSLLVRSLGGSTLSVSDLRKDVAYGWAAIEWAQGGIQ
jgi:hypothetical protein